MKKTLSFLLAMTFLFALFAGCGPTTAEETPGAESPATATEEPTAAQEATAAPEGTEAPESIYPLTEE